MLYYNPYKVKERNGKRAEAYPLRITRAPLYVYLRQHLISEGRIYCMHRARACKVWRDRRLHDSSDAATATEVGNIWPSFMTPSYVWLHGLRYSLLMARTRANIAQPGLNYLDQH